MQSFSSPFSYFVFLHWSFFMLGLVIYIFIFGVTHWKQYFNLDGKG